VIDPCRKLRFAKKNLMSAMFKPEKQKGCCL